MMEKNSVKKIRSIVILSLFVFGIFSPFLRPVIEGFTLPDGITELKLSSSNADFYAISESDYTTRWIMQGADIDPILNFTDDISGANWDLYGVSERIINTSHIPTDDSFVSSGVTDGNFGSWNNIQISYVTIPPEQYVRGFIKWEYPYLDLNCTTNSSLYVYLALAIHPVVRVYSTYDFDESTITWNNQPTTDNYHTTISPSTGWQYLDIGAPEYYYEFIDDDALFDQTRFYSSEKTNYEPRIIHHLSKNYQGGGYMYMQTNETELISLQSTDYGTHYNLSSGDYFEIDFETSSDSQINLILLKDGAVNKTLILSPSGNANFNRRTVQISVDEDVEFDQLKISSTFEDKDYIKVYDIKTYKYTIVGDYADFYVGSKSTHSVNLTSDTYNLRIFEKGTKKVDTNVTIGTSDYFYIYTPIETLDCRLALFNTGKENHLDFTDYHISINRSLNGEWNVFDLLDNIFTADEGTHVYINVSDSFDSLIDSFDKIAASYIDLELEVYSLQIKNLMEQKTTIDINGSYIYPLLSGDSLYFMLSKMYYQIGFYDEYNSYKNFTIYLNSNQAYQLNSSLKTIYFSTFTYDGLGINHDLVKFYINNERKDFGFNSMLEDTLELVILDFFNNTLANETIDANAYSNSEYNLFVEIYSLVILNQFTYEDIIVNITQVGSGVWMTQIIPKQFGLTYRFLPNVEYNVTIYFTNETFYDSRIVNLTSNSHIESFGVPTTTLEYPKNVYFGVYTTTGIGINHDLLRFYIDGVRTDFGFNRIEDMIITITVKDYFNSTLFNQMINTSGIYEYNILITLYSLKVKNEARVYSNYTLKLGALETTGYMLPEEIIEYQLSSNNYMFDYTNNEDGSFHTINVNLNENKVYVLNSTYYSIYFSLYDVNLHVFDPSQYEFRLNGTIQDLGSIEDLQSDNYNITIKDRFGMYLFNDVISLRGLNEYRIEIYLFELQIRHLATENGDLILIEDVSSKTHSFIMTPDSIKYVLMGASNYTLNWTNGENSQLTTFSIDLTSDSVIKLNTTYYDVYIGLYNFYGVVNKEEVKFYVNGTRADFGFNTIKSEYVDLLVFDFFNSILYNQIVRLEGLKEHSIFVQAYTLVVNNLYNNQSIIIKITRGSITIERLIEAQGWTEFKLYPNIEYEIISYVNGTKDEEKEVDLDDEYKTVNFGFFETEVPIIPPPIISPDIDVYIVGGVIISVLIVLGIVLYFKIRGGANRSVRATTRGEYNAYKRINWGKVGLVVLFIVFLIGIILIFIEIGTRF